MKNAQGCTPLHDAVNRGDMEIIQTLLEFGADPSIKATSGSVFDISSNDDK